MHGLMWRELETGSRAVTVMEKNDRWETAWPLMAPSPTAELIYRASSRPSAGAAPRLDSQDQRITRRFGVMDGREQAARH